MKSENQVQSNFLSDFAGSKFYMGKLANIVMNSRKKQPIFLYFLVDKGTNLLYNNKQRFNMCLCCQEVQICFLSLNPSFRMTVKKQVEYNLDLSGLDVDGVYPFKTPVVVTAKATNRASLITLVINAHFDYSRDCDRCGEPYTREMNMSFEHRLIQTLADEENDDYIETPDFTLELDDVVISDIFLSLPSKNLCRDDCKGLCQICGQNLNNGECSCDKRQTDPRLEILKQLID